MAWFSLLLREAQALHEAAQSGDLPAQRFFAYLFALPAECFLCDRPTCGPPICVVPDPTMKGWAILAPVCRECTLLPAPTRVEREFAMARAMWPRHKLVHGADLRLRERRP